MCLNLWRQTTARGKWEKKKKDRSEIVMCIIACHLLPFWFSLKCVSAVVTARVRAKARAPAAWHKVRRYYILYCRCACNCMCDLLVAKLARLVLALPMLGCHYFYGWCRRCCWCCCWCYHAGASTDVVKSDSWLNFEYLNSISIETCERASVWAHAQTHTGAKCAQCVAGGNKLRFYSSHTFIHLYI